LRSQLSLEGDEWLLDVGCGDGRVSATLVQDLPQGRVIGIDRSFRMVKMAQGQFPSEKWPNLEFLTMDAANLGFGPAFDWVFSNAALHWVADHRAALRGIYRALTPGGEALLQMGGQGNAAAAIKVFESRLEKDPWRDTFHEFPFPYYFYGPDDYRGWLAEAGLEPLRLELKPRDMVHDGPEGFAGWLRTTWLPYFQPLPKEKRPLLLEQVVDDYVKLYPADAEGQVHVAMVRLEVACRKPG
jgi:trans-aconitate 2-methyltransferase